MACFGLSLHAVMPAPLEKAGIWRPWKQVKVVEYIRGHDFHLVLYSWFWVPASLATAERGRVSDLAATWDSWVVTLVQWKGPKKGEGG